MQRKKRKWGLLVILGLVGLCVSAILFTAIINVFIPQTTENPNRLSAVDIARVLEADHLRQQLGEQVFPGFQSQDIPDLLFNEQNAFLLGMSDPSTGWVKVPQGSQRGGEWQLMPALEEYPQETYYRTGYDRKDPSQSPDAFTMLIGESYVTSVPSAEWFRLGLMNQFRNDLPPFLKPIFPYSLVASIFFPNSDTFLSMIQHESFHAFQAQWAPERFEQAEWDKIRLDEQYPWHDQAGIDAWQSELDLLTAALKAEDQESLEQLTQKFLDQRIQRREIMQLSTALIRFENQREWVEGMARYAELETWRLAANDSTYQPLTDMNLDEKFRQYNTFEERWRRELDQISRMAENVGDGRFYYTGMAQAYLLDQLDPSWKTKLAADPSLNLEDLLAEAVNNN